MVLLWQWNTAHLRRYFTIHQRILLDEIVQICIDKLYSLHILPCTVSKTLLEFAARKCHFNFDGKYYEQTDGVAMGSPVGPMLANILKMKFMCYFEEKWVMTDNASLSIWFTYIDNTFTMHESKDTPLTFL